MSVSSPRLWPSEGNAVLIWDRPNCGESDVCFEGSSESAMQADALAGLLGHLGMTPAVIIGGSGGARVSLLAAARHRGAACRAGRLVDQRRTVRVVVTGHPLLRWVAPRRRWTEGMDAVAALDEWSEALERNPGNRQRILDQDPASLRRHHGALDAGLLPPRRRARTRAPGRRGAPSSTCRPSSSAAAPATPTTPGRHRRRWRELLPRSELVEPPWGDREWIERQEVKRGRHLRPLAPVGADALGLAAPYARFLRLSRPHRTHRVTSPACPDRRLTRSVRRLVLP